MFEILIDAGLDAFGEPLEYIYSDSKDRVMIKGIFGNAYVETPLEDGRMVSDQMPAVDIRISDLSRIPKEDDLVIIRGTRYAVRESREDGEGATKLLLLRIGRRGS